MLVSDQGGSQCRLWRPGWRFGWPHPTLDQRRFELQDFCKALVCQPSEPVELLVLECNEVSLRVDASPAKDRDGAGRQFGRTERCVRILRELRRARGLGFLARDHRAEGLEELCPHGHGRGETLGWQG